MAAAAKHPYWGDLEGPKVDRTGFREHRSMSNGYDENIEAGRNNSNRASQQRQERTSINSQLRAVSDNSPFVSPTASTFRADGLAPRPSSYQYPSNDPTVIDYDKGRRRANRESIGPIPEYTSSILLPSAPDPPTARSPTSHKYAQLTGSGRTSIQSDQRSRDPRRSNIIIDTNQGQHRQFIDEAKLQSFQGPGPRQPSDVYAALRANRGRGSSPSTRERDRTEKEAFDNPRRSTVERTGSLSRSHPRTNSYSYDDRGRQREVTVERSPLQKLESTLDSLSKEEKRARVKQAEKAAQDRAIEAESVRQNSVRFRNRPIVRGAGTSETVISSQSAQPMRGEHTNQRELPARAVADSGLVVSDHGPPVPPKDLEPTRDRIHHQTARQFEKSAIPSRHATFRERSERSEDTEPPGIAGAAGELRGVAIGRPAGNKLKKDPAGDPWFTARMEAERRGQEAVRRKIATESTENAIVPDKSTRPVRAISAAEADIRSKKRRAVFHPLDPEGMYSDEEEERLSRRRGGPSKLEQLTGERNIPSRSEVVPVQQQLYADKLDRSEELGPMTHASNAGTMTEQPVHGHKFAVAPEVAAVRFKEDIAAAGADGHHHFTNIFHDRDRQRFQPGRGLYKPIGQLDEWRTAEKATLTGPLLDLEKAPLEQTEADKDKAWWEAGNTGRRKSSTRRVADRYDGVDDDSHGIVKPQPDPKEHMSAPTHPQPAVKTWKNTPDIIVPRARLFIGHYGTDDQEDKARRRDKSFKIGETSHSCAGKPGQILRWHDQTSIMATAGLSAYETACLNKAEHNILHPFHICTSLSSSHTRLTPTMRLVRVPDQTVPTSFKPPLYLKCGPLLRYCGMRKEVPPVRPGGAPRPPKAIWRGSIMIVTSDSKSSYESAPILRLFSQPGILLPPPPQQVDGNLDPQYIDPLAGLPKIGRDGSTLYVRPVEELEENKDFSSIETDDGLFGRRKSIVGQHDGTHDGGPQARHRDESDGERVGKYVEVRGFKLHAEYDCTFWRFNVEVELTTNSQRIAYRINRGPAVGFWVPPKGEAMNIMFHSCNGFSLSVNPDQFSGPDPMWRDVLNTHQTQPFHVMIGGGDQLYNDCVMKDTTIFAQWLAIKNPLHKHNAPFTPQMQHELELFYLNRYSMWFSQGLFGLANSQIPMVNIYDDHDIIDGFGSYPHHFMDSPVFAGLGAVAFKYYMLFQHQSVINEGEETEPSWLLGQQPGPYIKELSRSVFMSMGQGVSFLGLDCRTERTREEVISLETMDLIFDRCSDEIRKGETKHLIVLLGVPIAYPRLVWLENILTSRLMEPVKAMGRAGMFGNLLNQFDGGVEILDDLDDHWTAKNHKKERLHLIQDLQDIAAEKSVRVTILGGDVHLAAIGQFYSNPKLGIPKDKDHRYMPNVISSAIVNTPPPEMMADVLNKRNKVHHLDDKTDENMIPIFTHDVNGSKRNNRHLLPRRNWCSIRTYDPEMSPPPTPTQERSPSPSRGGLYRRLSSYRGPSYRAEASGPKIPSRGSSLLRRLSLTRKRVDDGTPASDVHNARRRSLDDRSRPPITMNNGQSNAQPPRRSLSLTRAFKPGGLFHRTPSKKKRNDNINGYDSESGDEEDYSDDGYENFQQHLAQRGQHRQQEQYPPRLRGGAGAVPNAHGVNLDGGLEITLHVEISQSDPAGITTPYRLLVPALWYEGDRQKK